MTRLEYLHAVRDLIVGAVVLDVLIALLCLLALFLTREP